MTNLVRIHAGSYRNEDCSNKVVELVEGFKLGAKGGYLTVRNGGNFPGYPDTVKIKVANEHAYTVVNGLDQSAALPVTVPVITDADLKAQIRERFSVMTDMAQAAAEGNIRAQIVRGGPGVGKSHGIETVLERAVLCDRVRGDRVRCEFIKGAISAPELYCKLYEYQGSTDVLVFDDCDSMFADEDALNLLKGALDTKKDRKISWLKDSNTLRANSVPQTFTFRGAVIFISNLQFDNVKANGKLGPHLAALVDRCHYQDLGLDTIREKILRIEQVFEDGDLFSDYDFDAVAGAEIIDFIKHHQNDLRSVSLRTCIKIADLRACFPTRWKQQAAVTVLKNSK